MTDETKTEIRPVADVIADAVASVCSDGNADARSVAGDVLAALDAAGFVLAIKADQRFQLYDTATGRPAGSATVPSDVLEAAAKVERWMQANRVTTLHGLRLA